MPRKKSKYLSSKDIQVIAKNYGSIPPRTIAENLGIPTYKVHASVRILRKKYGLDIPTRRPNKEYQEAVQSLRQSNPELF